MKLEKKSNFSPKGKKKAPKNNKAFEEAQSAAQQKHLISGGLEPPAFCVLDRCDNHYTTRSHTHRVFYGNEMNALKQSRSLSDRL